MSARRPYPCFHGDIVIRYLKKENPMKALKFVVVLGLGLGITTAFAVEHSIGQKGRHFSESEITIKKGDSILFVNDDNISHNVLSTTSGNEFNLHSQAPGTSTSVTFDKTGDISVICAIHPTMKMLVKVVD
jgi:plastocyanin